MHSSSDRASTHFFIPCLRKGKLRNKPHPTFNCDILICQSLRFSTDMEGPSLLAPFYVVSGFQTWRQAWPLGRATDAVAQDSKPAVGWEHIVGIFPFPLPRSQATTTAFGTSMGIAPMLCFLPAPPPSALQGCTFPSTLLGHVLFLPQLPPPPNICHLPHARAGRLF